MAVRLIESIIPNAIAVTAIEVPPSKARAKADPTPGKAADNAHVEQSLKHNHDSHSDDHKSGVSAIAMRSYPQGASEQPQIQDQNHNTTDQPQLLNDNSKYIVGKSQRQP